MNEADAVVYEEAQSDERTQLGFWIYLMTDCVLFASLFATFIVLRGNTYGGPGGGELFELPFVLGETMLLLTSSFICGMVVLAARAGKVRLALGLLAGTLLLGGAFLAMELTEFSKLVHEGHSWQASAFLSAFFTLVGTHGAHIAVGMLWGLVLAWQLAKRGITRTTSRQLMLFSMFWHFLDVVWIFIFTVVYLMGVV